MHLWTKNTAKADAGVPRPFIKDIGRFLLVLLTVNTLALKYNEGGGRGDGLAQHTPEATIESDIQRGMKAQRSGEGPCSARLASTIADDGDDAWFAASEIRKNHCVGLLSSIIKLTKHPHSRVRENAAGILGSFKERSATHALVGLLNDEEELVAKAALGALCEIGAEDCRTQLAEIALNDPRWRMRLEAVIVASRIGLEFTSEQVMSLFDDKVVSVGERALEGLPCATLARPEVVQSVIAFAREVVVLPLHTNEGTRSRGYAAVGLLGKCHPPDVGEILAEILAQVQRYRVEEMRTTSLVDAIGECPAKSSRDVIEEFSHTHPSPPDMASITESNIRVPCEAAFDVLGRIGGASSVQSVRAGLLDSYYRVRMATLRTAEKLHILCSIESDLASMARNDPSEIVRKEAEGLVRRIQLECKSAK